MTCLAVAASCAAQLPQPPANPRMVALQPRFLLGAPTGITGDPQPIADGVWCAGDGAFSLPVVPFPDGPTEFSGKYYDGGVTSILDMLDRHESVLEVARPDPR